MQEHRHWIALIESHLDALVRAHVAEDLDSLFTEPHFVQRTNAGFGVQHIHSEQSADGMFCETDVLLFDKRISDWVLKCRPSGSWEELRTRFLTAIPSLRSDGDHVVATGTNVSAASAASARRAAALGPRAPVTAPSSLASDYNLLVSAGELVVGDLCGMGAAETIGHAAVRRIEAAHRTELLRNILRGPNAEARVLAARVLRAVPTPDPGDLATIAALAAHPHVVIACSGCMQSPEPVATSLAR